MPHLKKKREPPPWQTPEEWDNSMRKINKRVPVIRTPGALDFDEDRFAAIPWANMRERLSIRAQARELLPDQPDNYIPPIRLWVPPVVSLNPAFMGSARVRARYAPEGVMLPGDGVSPVLPQPKRPRVPSPVIAPVKIRRQKIKPRAIADATVHDCLLRISEFWMVRMPRKEARRRPLPEECTVIWEARWAMEEYAEHGKPVHGMEPELLEQRKQKFRQMRKGNSNRSLDISRKRYNNLTRLGNPSNESLFDFQLEPDIEDLRSPLATKTALLTRWLMTKHVTDLSHQREIWPQQKREWNPVPDTEKESEETYAGYCARNYVPDHSKMTAPKPTNRIFPSVDRLKAMAPSAFSEMAVAASAIQVPNVRTRYKQGVWKDITDLAPRALFRQDRGYKLLYNFEMPNDALETWNDIHALGWTLQKRHILDTDSQHAHWGSEDEPDLKDIVYNYDTPCTAREPFGIRDSGTNYLRMVTIRGTAVVVPSPPDEPHPCSRQVRMNSAEPEEPAMIIQESDLDLGRPKSPHANKDKHLSLDSYGNSSQNRFSGFSYDSPSPPEEDREQSPQEPKDIGRLRNENRASIDSMIGWAKLSEQFPSNDVASRPASSNLTPPTPVLDISALPTLSDTESEKTSPVNDDFINLRRESWAQSLHGSVESLNNYENNESPKESQDPNEEYQSVERTPRFCNRDTITSQEGRDILEYYDNQLSLNKVETNERSYVDDTDLRYIDTAYLPQSTTRGSEVFDETDDLSEADSSKTIDLNYSINCDYSEQHSNSRPEGLIIEDPSDDKDETGSNDGSSDDEESSVDVDNDSDNIDSDAMKVPGKRWGQLLDDSDSS
ncbi:hypothetical protein EDC01DRAFT_636286 [Geopyxis carbonaria]|nr:hypothetical protein EDC01DRAFT_636286 [Geopyxis carbonaria]